MSTVRLADIVRRHGNRYREKHALPMHQHRLLRAIENCRTATRVFYGNPYQAAWGAAMNLYVPVPVTRISGVGGKKAGNPVSGRLLVSVYTLNGILDENVPWWFAQV